MVIKVNIDVKEKYIPGTIVPKSSMNGVTGLEFLDKIFFMADGVMLSRIREITGIDGSTIQNWVKRGWLGNTVNKQYSEMHLARILIINMLRTTMKLEKIDFLLHYINGNLNSRVDDIIPEQVLFDYICKIVDRADESGTVTPELLRGLICDATEDYVERLPGAKKRLESALEVIILSYYASVVCSYSEEKFSELRKG